MKCFEKYQPFELPTQKLHALYHPRVRSIEYLHAGLFESSHKEFKQIYSQKSKQINFPMDEVVK